jgi:hypothetical protein
LASVLWYEKERFMNLVSTRSLARTLAVLGWLLASTGCAQSFQLVSQGRWVRINGSAFILGRDGRPGIGDASRFQARGAGTNFSPFNGTESFVLDVTAPDGTATAHLLGTASQTSTIATNAFRYEGGSAMSASTSGTPGSGSSWTIQGQ